MHSMGASSSRILYDVPCAVCLDHSSGKHYGVYACDGCAGFFKRSVRRDRRYTCKARRPGGCLVDKAHRNQCRSCRLDKCLQAGMNRDAVQHERGPRNSTIRRQMALFFKEPIPRPTRESVSPRRNLTMMEHNVLLPQPIPLYNTYSYPSLSLLRPPLLLAPPQMTSSSLMTGPEFVFRANDSATMCEAAARLLFMNVQWAKNIPAFTVLSLEDRICLLEKSWKHLFVLGAAQFLYPMDFNVLVDRNNAKLSPAEVEIFVTTLKEITSSHPDANEYACLRALLLFKTCFMDRMRIRSPGLLSIENRKLQDVRTVTALQDQSTFMLNEYVHHAYPEQMDRPSQLLQLLPIIGRVPSLTIIDLFFKATIGEIPIERILADMYTSSSGSE